MASTSYASISSSELSHLVLEYLQSEGFSDTFEQVRSLPTKMRHAERRRSDDSLTSLSPPTHLASFHRSLVRLL